MRALNWLCWLTPSGGASPLAAALVRAGRRLTVRDRRTA
jgi:hypothetical protein